jgi:hypothetical protein
MRWQSDGKGVEVPTAKIEYVAIFLSGVLSNISTGSYYSHVAVYTELTNYL